MKALLALPLLACLVLAGCATRSDSGGGLPEPQVQVTDSTGGIRGVVVDQAIRPLAGATVTVTGPGTSRNTTTDATGGFSVAGLKPGLYLLKASKPLYDTQQQSIEVKAGVAPPVTKVQLVQVIFAKPYMQTLKFKGFIVCSLGTGVSASEECGEGVGVPCTQDPAPCGRQGGQGDNKVQYDFHVDGPFLRTLVIEQAWQANSEATGKFYTVAPAVNWTCDPVCGGNEMAVVQGASPLLSRIEADGAGTAFTSDNKTVPFDAATTFSTFTWPDWAACSAGITENPACLTQFNYAANQEFTLFVSTFYYLPAPAGWSFIDGGANPF
ncbi:MAG: Carboxypeptidase regulatory-like domain [Thermoplasmata archaeon]|nr:Carboxypeptidase regulatory-like domain [Thermoplasmata archaeon]